MCSQDINKKDSSKIDKKELAPYFKIDKKGNIKRVKKDPYKGTPYVTISPSGEIVRTAERPKDG